MENIDLVKSYVAQEGGLFVGPHSAGTDDSILQVGADGLIGPVPRDELPNECGQALNHKTLLGMFRAAVEQGNA